jgi:preflagellin peptidase FlaK
LPDHWLDILRVAVCLAILGYSCITDWKTRRAPNRLWYIMGGIGLVLGLFQLYEWNFNTSLIFSWAFGAIFVFVLVYFIYYFFQYFGMSGLGGADAKALIAIAILFPYYPYFDISGISLPLTDVTRSIIFGFTVFGNALALNLVVPLAILALNLMTVPLGELMADPLGAFTGYKVSIDGLKGKHVRLMHRYSEENGELKKKRALSGSEVDEGTYQSLLKWKKDGKVGDKVWITPKIPFLIPITLGFIVAIVWGDILMRVISLFLFH